MIVLHDADDHAPFAHYEVTIPTTTINIRDARTRAIHTETRAGTFIVCYFCGHWINRPMRACNCPASCHAEALAFRE